ncbi:hypothetical protein RhiJN_04445 [Ceratobasidium sp. AG-Ba]|nr:hypothetical protein RhiJN_04445 [Ceratobasidium sp. AG-Ba]
MRLYVTVVAYIFLVVPVFATSTGSLSLTYIARGSTWAAARTPNDTVLPRQTIQWPTYAKMLQQTANEDEPNGVKRSTAQLNEGANVVHPETAEKNSVTKTQANNEIMTPKDPKSEYMLNLFFSKPLTLVIRK